MCAAPVWMLGEFTEWKELWCHQHPAQEAEARDTPITLCQSLPQLPQFLWAPRKTHRRVEFLETGKKGIQSCTHISIMLWSAPTSCHQRHGCFTADKVLTLPRSTQLRSSLGHGEGGSNSVPPGYLVDSSNSLRVRSNHSLEKLITFFFRDCYWFSLWHITHITILDNISFSSLTS